MNKSISYIAISVVASVMLSGCLKNKENPKDNLIISKVGEKTQKVYNLKDYIIPEITNSDEYNINVSKFKGSKKIEEIKENYKSIDYKTIVQIPSYTNTEKIKYIDENGQISAEVLRNDKIRNKVKFQKQVTLGDPVLTNPNKCKIAEHYDNYERDGEEYSDVLKIVCGEDMGYFAKGKGIILYEIKKDENYKLNDHLLTNGSILKNSNNIYEPNNVESAHLLNVDDLYNDPYYLSGEGIRVGIVDIGLVYNGHEALKDVKLLHTSDNEEENAEHATHIAGTIGGRVLEDSPYHGIAPLSDMYSMSTMKFAFASAMKYLNNNYDIYLTNHSYTYKKKETMGEYDDTSLELDKSVKENPYLVGVYAAGNDKNQPDYADWGIIKAPGNSKNVLTIGSISNQKELSDFSSVGPVKDGRIKPDLVAKGENVISASNEGETEYKTMSGTSMAAPAITGSISLLMEGYKKYIAPELEIPNDNMRFDLIKSVLIESAEDLGNVGPDYKYGYGLPDIKKSAEILHSVLTDKPLVLVTSIKNNEEKSYSFTVNDNMNFKSTISWVDPEDEQKSSTKNLVNDIDTWIEDENGNIIAYPYTLDKDNPDEPATTDKLNHVDNTEEIETNLEPGNYILKVKGNDIKDENQVFSLVTNISLTSNNSDNSEVINDNQPVFDLPLSEFINIIIGNNL